MSKAQTLSKLEALLNRVRARAGEPRVALAAAPVAAVHAAPPPPVLAPPVMQAEEAEDLESTQQRHVPVRGGQRTESEIVVEVDVQASTTDSVLAVPVEEIQVPEATESRERLVAAEPAALEPAVELSAEREPAPELMATVVDAEVEEIEEAPASSRRPVAPQPEERLAEMAFGAEEPQPARHTPPPESGRLPAAPAAPVVDSAGAAEFEGDVTGVHEASKPASLALAGQAAPVAIVPEMYSADIAPSDAVADVVGQAKQPPPETFLAALDASIAL